MLVNILDEEVKGSIIRVLEDPDIAQGVTDYGDALFSRYFQKVTGWIGGKQQGINRQVEAATPKLDILDDEGNISLSGILKGFLSGQFRNILGGQSSQSSPVSSSEGQNAPNM